MGGYYGLCGKKDREIVISVILDKRDDGLNGTNAFVRVSTF